MKLKIESFFPLIFWQMCQDLQWAWELVPICSTKFLKNNPQNI